MGIRPLCLGLVLMATPSALGGDMPTATNQGVQIQVFSKSDSGEKILTDRIYLSDLAVVTVSGLQPKKIYTLQNTFLFYGKVYRSYIKAQADQGGVVSTDVVVPLDGTYHQRDEDGLFWSLTAQSQIPVGTQAPGTYRFEVNSEEGLNLATRDVPQAYLKPGVQKVDLTGTGLVGALYLPPKELGPRPAVITFGGSEGGVMGGVANAIYLANHGFVALGLGYFGASGLPPELVNVPLEYFETAIKYLQSRPEVAKDQIAVVGASRGGELALLLGATFPQIRAVVAQVPSPIVWSGTGQGIVPAWTYHGAPIPFMALDTSSALTPETLPDGRIAYLNRPFFEKAVKDNPAMVANSTTPVQKINGPVFMYGGENDGVWPSCDFVSAAMEMLQNSQRKFKDEGACYKNAGHLVAQIPNNPSVETVILHPTFGKLLDTGGTPAANAAGQRDAWNRTFKFLNASFAQ
jgi:dienelactone hydrolase